MLSNVPMVRAGDVLVVCVERHLTEMDTQRFVDMASDVLPGVRVAFLEGVSGLAVFRPDAATSEAESE
ncbi:hypothetical protein SGFS_065710 [Streptomyces graminofaciens]|uniref:Uncharacterized protein n=1 Tax=Streptomyces graminofaciens TaxID=68212 RepID=A0ABN5VP70_9ACTN|nr:hypothetical protein [Streptomyces graminofaciens]BBC35277.1 hypothetical protein SGFS_065710 [Streptomyces graminofaciens]